MGRDGGDGRIEFSVLDGIDRVSLSFFLSYDLVQIVSSSDLHRHRSMTVISHE